MPLPANFEGPKGPYGWIQWKGTNVCMDVHCECGAHGHIDAEFAYTLQCKHCGRIYAVDGHVRLCPIERSEALCTIIEFEDNDLTPDPAS